MSLAAYGSVLAMALERYKRPPRYDVWWNGHIRWVEETQLTGIEWK